ncbi:TRAP transporter small permease [Plastorhodobacter daqingensis]|uniref:TRAP transporter small permease protein n=1 Tax=Plastorhodobacter daqingensis TaxID=1387281 RepID=A0ABW2UMF9_9RHOB
MEQLRRGVDLSMSFLATLASLGVLVMMVHVCADVIWRQISGGPLPATVEIVSRYYMVLVAFLPLAWVERRGGMVRVELIDGFLSRRMILLSDVMAALLAAAVYFGLSYASWGIAMRNYNTGTFVTALQYAVPVWPTYFLAPLGFLLAGLVVMLRALFIATGTDARGDNREALQ